MIYSAFCIQFGGNIGTANDMGLPSFCQKFVREAAFAELSGAEDDAVGGEKAALAAPFFESDAQAVLLDCVIADATHHFDTLGA